MKWYFRYPIVTLLVLGHAICDEAEKVWPTSDSFLPTTSGDFAGALAISFLFAAGGLFFYPSQTQSPASE